MMKPQSYLQLLVLGHFSLGNTSVLVVARVGLQRTAGLCVGPCGLNIMTSQLGVFQNTGIKRCGYLM